MEAVGQGLETLYHRRIGLVDVDIGGRGRDKAVFDAVQPGEDQEGEGDVRVGLGVGGTQFNAPAGTFDGGDADELRPVFRRPHHVFRGLEFPPGAGRIDGWD